MSKITRCLKNQMNFVLKERKDDLRTNQTITAEGMANFKLGNTCWNDSTESPSQVYLNFSE